MPSPNPYETPAVASVAPDERPLARLARPLTGDERQVASHARLGLRLLGVYFGARGLYNLIYSLVYLIVSQQQGYDAFRDSYMLGWLVMSIAYFVAGWYLAMRAPRIVELVFLPSSDGD